MEISNKIKGRRQLLGITQQDLADISGIGLRTIKQMEAGEANPSLSTLVCVLNVLGLEIEFKIKNRNE